MRVGYPLQPFKSVSEIASNLSQRTAIRIAEIFYSLQGESSRMGLPTVFIRLTGCPLRCRYCDTTYAYAGGSILFINEILDQVARYETDYVTVTGGEPLAQKACLPLLKQLCDRGYQVSLETSGALDVSGVDHRVKKVVDLKTLGSGEEFRNRYENLQVLSPHDEIKIVICDRQDYEWAREKLRGYDLTSYCEVLFSPCSGQLDPAVLANWILEDQLPVRFQIQLHKVLWGNVP